MLQFIFYIIMMASVSVILFLFARALPRIDDTNTTPPSVPQLPHWIVGYIERCDEILLSSFEKFLRRMRVSLLKFDNAVSEKLKRFAQHNTQKENMFVNRVTQDDRVQKTEDTI